METNSLSDRDTLRIEKSFFSTPSVQKENKNYKKKRLVFILSSSFALSLIVVFLLYNFKIIILPRPSGLAQSKIVDLLTRNEPLELELFQPQGSSKIFKNIIYLDIPYMRKSGFSLNFKEKIDMRGTKLILLVKNPHPDLKMDVVLRDERFFSNARNPIKLEVPHQSKKSNYNKISIPLENQIDSQISLARIKQLRFIFQPQKVESLPILIKKIFLEKGGE